MRLFAMLGAAAALAVAACETTTPPNGQGASIEDACRFRAMRTELDEVKDALLAANGEAAYASTLRERYGDLDRIGREAAAVGDVNEPAYRVGCLLLSAEAAMIQTLLPLDQRPAGAADPALAAVQRAQAARSACGGAATAQQGASVRRHCAVAALIEQAAPAQAAELQIRAADRDPASTASPEGWTHLADVMRGYGANARGWPQVRSTLATTPPAEDEGDHDYATQFLSAPTCFIQLQGNHLIRDRLPDAGAPGREEAVSYVGAYRAAVASSVAGLGLPVAERDVIACETNMAGGDPTGDACEATRQALLAHCTPLLERLVPDEAPN